jgi:hypothetical protein
VTLAQEDSDGDGFANGVERATDGDGGDLVDAVDSQAFDKPAMRHPRSPSFRPPARHSDRAGCPDDCQAADMDGTVRQVEFADNGADYMDNRSSRSRIGVGAYALTAQR